jgi:UDP-N-acetylmuramoyl-tripeptide--D-alanyl-D-alanine ligase
MLAADELYKYFLKNSKICTDTRKIIPDSIFFALKGKNFNGNAYAKKALELGAAYAVIDEPEYAISKKYLLVNDVLKALQELSTLHRQQINIPVIAIVGSNGKTTTKELISSVLATQYHVLSTPGNLNNHIGLPLTLLMLNKTHEIAIIEMGANHIGENEFLCKLAKPTHGIITNNGKDHLEGFGSLEGVAQSNSELYYYLLKNNGKAYVNANDEWLMRMSRGLTNKITYAANTQTKHAIADVVAVALQLQPEIKFIYDNIEFTSCLSGDYNFDNIMAAVAIGNDFGITTQNIKNGIEAYIPANLRSQFLKTDRNTIFLDAYNANPSSMEVSIRNFAMMPYENKIVILGDMFELGKFEAEEHQNIVNLCKKFNFKEVILTGEAFSKTQHSFKSFINTNDAKNYLSELKPTNCFVFIKGSRGMKLEELLTVL